MRREKEEIMTNALTYIKDFVETEEVDYSNSNPKIDFILVFLELKILAYKSKEKINQYIIKDKTIRNGQAILAGTRITTKELMTIISELKPEQDLMDYITKQYPSIDCKEKVLYGSLYEIKKMNLFFTILGIIVSR